MRSRMRAAAAIGLALVALSACGGAANQGGKTTITFSYLWSGTEGQAMQRIVDDFNRSQSSVVVKGVSSPDGQKQLASMASSHGTFDVSDSYNSLVGAWASKGIIAPLDDFISHDHYQTGDFVASALPGMRYQGKTYELPIALGNYQLLYNKSEFAAAGIAGPPATTDVWAADIAKLTKTDAAGSVTQLGLGSTSSGSLDPGLLVMAYSFGGGWFDGAGRPAAEASGNAAAIKFYTDNVSGRYGVQNVLKFASGFGDYASAQNSFLSGKVAMAIDGEWMSQFATEYAPNLQWGVAPIPYPSDRPDLKGTSYVQSSTLFIPTNSQHKDAAWQFIKFALSQDKMLQFTKALGNLPARTSLLGNAAYNSLPNFSGWEQALKTGHQHSLPSATFNQEYLTDLGTTLGDAAAVKSSPQDLLSQLKARTRTYAG